MSKRKHATGVEALDAIVAEMCDEMTAVHLMKATDLETLHSIQAGLRKLADRIVNAVYQALTEAATRAATDAVNLTNEKWERDCGNAAKLRDTLERLDKWASKLQFGTEALEAANIITPALAAPARNCDKRATNADEAIVALKQRFPVEEFFAGFEMAAKWLYDTQDYCLGEVADRPFGQPEKGGAK